MSTVPRSVALAVALASGLAVHPGAAQEVRAVRGVTRSAADSAPLPGVRVRVLETGARDETDASGQFAFPALPRVTLHLEFQRLGIAPDTAEVPPDVSWVAVLLRPRAVTMRPLLAEGAMPARQRFEALAQTSTVSLDPAEIASAPMPVAPDVARVAQLLPGTIAKNDYSVGINVRGGESDQNLIRLDGITVFNPFHLGGLFSTFDAAAVEHVDLITGGFPAEYGGRLSSVMDVGLRAGRRDRVGLRGGVSLLAAGLLTEGPLGSDGTSFLIGARRTYADALASAFSTDAFGLHFADAVAKLSLPVGRGRVSATGYWGRDVLDLPWVDAEPGRQGVDLQFSWGNRLAGITWVQPIGTAMLEHHVDVSQFTTRFALAPEQLDSRNSVRQLTARTALVARLGERNDIQVGIGVEDHRIRYWSSNASVDHQLPDGIWVGDRRIPYDFRMVPLGDQVLELDYRPRIWFAYLDDQWRPLPGLLLRPGLRVEYVDGGSSVTVLSPRVGIKAFLTDELALTGSVGRYHQALHSIRDQEVPITLVDFWIGADARTPVARSDHLVLGVERWIGPDVSLTLEGYAKTYDRLPLRSLQDDPRILGDEFVIATGRAWGFDLLIRKHWGGIRGWISYGWGKATRSVGGESFPPAHDRRHTVNVVVHAPGPLGSAMSLHWGYGSGLPYTEIAGQWSHREYNADLHLFERPQDEVFSTTVNGARFPHYSRLDVGLRWQFEWLGASCQPYVTVVNVYNRRNVFAYVFDYGRVPPTRSGWSQLPVLPTVGVEFTW